MLTTIINNPPYTKIIIIEDSLELNGSDIFNYIFNYHLKQQKFGLHYFVFSGKYKKKEPSIRIKSYDFVSNLQGWLAEKNPSFKEIVEEIQDNAVIFIDSLAHMVFAYGVSETYKLLHQLQKRHNIVQIVTLLHEDLLENTEEVLKFFQHLSTLYIALEEKFNSMNKRVSYIYKKPGGKVIREIEEYYIQHTNMVSVPVKKIDAKALVEQNLQQTLPDNLTTFRLSLDEKEKESRSKLVLPYLPKAVEEPGGKITYKFDEVDDWDEEDPDDDLDI